jgi:hypothetical protein
MQFCVTFAFSYLSSLSLFYFNMDKFLIKRRKNEDESVTECNSIKSENETIPSVSAVKAIQRDARSLGTVRKYQNSYLNFGFTYSEPENRPVPECVVCREQLSNECMVPSKLKIHLNTKHSHLSRKDNNYFSQLLSSEVKQAKVMEKRATISESTSSQL